MHCLWQTAWAASELETSWCLRTFRTVRLQGRFVFRSITVTLITSAQATEGLGIKLWNWFWHVLAISMVTGVRLCERWLADTSLLPFAFSKTWTKQEKMGSRKLRMFEVWSLKIVEDGWSIPSSSSTLMFVPLLLMQMQFWCWHVSAQILQSLGFRQTGLRVEFVLTRGYIELVLSYTYIHLPHRGHLRVFVLWTKVGTHFLVEQLFMK